MVAASVSEASARVPRRSAPRRTSSTDTDDLRRQMAFISRQENPATTGPVAEFIAAINDQLADVQALEADAQQRS